MDISINNNAIFAGTVNPFAGVEGAASEGMKVGSAAADNLKVDRAKGGANVAATAAPEIDPPEETPGEIVDQVDSLQEKVAAYAAKQAEGAKAHPAAVHALSSILFDVYQLMMLMLIAGQTQKKLAQATRTQQHLAMQSSYQSQADALRDAAKSVFLKSIVAATISSVTTLVSVGMTASQFSKLGNAGKMAGDPAEEGEQLAALKQGNEALSSDPTKTVADEAFSADTRAAGAEFEKAQAQVEEAQTEVGAKKDALAQAEGDLKAKQEELKNAPASQKAELEAEVKELQGKVETAKSELQLAENKLQGAVDHFNEAKATYLTELDNDMKRLDAKIEEATAAISEFKGKGDAKNQEQKSFELRDAKNARAFVKAWHKIAAKSDFNFPANSGDVKSMMRQLEAKIQHKIDQFERLYTMAGGRWCESMSQLMTSTGNLVDQWCKAFSERDSQLAQSELKVGDARQEGARAQLENMNELVQGAQELINTILQMIRSFVQVENESMQAAIRA